MNRLFPALAVSLLASCVTLPGDEDSVPVRHALQGPDTACERGADLLGLRVVQAAPGLASDRIAVMDGASGEISYLKDLRWAETSTLLLQQRLATDLECRGRVVQTVAGSGTARDKLVCEMRAFNLVRTSTGDEASVALSCLLHRADGGESSLLPAARVPLSGWNTGSAMRALDAAYGRMFDQLADGLR
jgi:ABC-type uncharacterized transport system auxiliary subunit